MFRQNLLLLFLPALLTLSHVAKAAESYDSCAGFIDSVPATLSTQGVWCLRGDLSTAIASGNAITIATNNVTIDCNGFKIGGLGGGTSSNARGIYAEDRQNATVRNCSVRGFHTGIYFDGGAGHLIEDNRLDQILYTGIRVTGDNNRVRRNAVYDTGGHPLYNVSIGIIAAADIIDNTVAGVFAAMSTGATPRGIIASGPGTEVRGNQIRGLAGGSGGFVYGISATAAGVRVSENQITATVATTGYGISGAGATTFCTGNTVANFGTAFDGCEAISHNLDLP